MKGIYLFYRTTENGSLLPLTKKWKLREKRPRYAKYYKCEWLVFGQTNFLGIIDLGVVLAIQMKKLRVFLNNVKSKAKLKIMLS